MQTVDKIRSKIDQANDLLSVVKTMKGLAAVRVRQFQHAVEGLRGYAETVERAFEILLHDRPGAVRFQEQELGQGVLAVIVGSDQGLVGQFNQRVLEFAKDDLAGLADETRVLAVGRQVAQAVRMERLDLEDTFPLPRSAEGTESSARRVLLTVERLRVESSPRRIVLYHNRPLGSASYEPAVREVMPLSGEWLEKLAEREWPTNNVPFHRESWDDLLFRTVQQHIHLVLLQGMGESLAAENSSRMAAMQAAESNIEERVGNLRQLYHRRRQSTITEELLDVISGFETTGEQS